MDVPRWPHAMARRCGGRPTSEGAAARESPLGASMAAIALAIGLPAMLVAGLLGVVATSARPSRTVAMTQQARLVGQALFAYALENRAGGNAYPDGASSTAIFQLLLDRRIVTDPALFYVPMPGKQKPSLRQPLEPRNVSFDVTGGVGPLDNDGVPLVYLTGYRVTFARGAAAVRIARPVFFSEGLWLLEPGNGWAPGVAVFYKGNDARWIGAQGNAVPNFIPAYFNAHGKTYRQLTPDGVLR